MKHFIYTEPGEGHQNEDAALVKKLPGSEHARFCALADGQGGQAGGALAAQLAVNTAIGGFSPELNTDLLKAELWYLLISQVDELVAEFADAGFTTLIALFVNQRRVTGVSCGDSAALLLQNGTPCWLTEKQRKNPPVGSSEAFPVAFAADLHGPWKLLLMSDGVWRYVGDEAVAQIAAERSGNEMIAALRQAALDGNGGRLGDDFTIILVQSD